MKNVFVLFATFALVAPAFSKTFTRCSLAKELSRLGVARKELAIWTCIAQHESSFRTNAVGTTNKNGSNDYGIFQINNYYWCQPVNGRFSHNQCKLSCNDLLTDDITNSVRCAQQVKRQQGFKAWSTWKYCNGTVPSIETCF